MEPSSHHPPPPRSPLPSPPPPTTTTPISQQPRYITFRHPAYPEPSNILLRLYAPDLPGRRALDAGYALVACGIVAGNRWDGWLTEKIDERRRISPMSILELPNYYFHLPPRPQREEEQERQEGQEGQERQERQGGQQEEQVGQEKHDDFTSRPYIYPVVPAFDEWTFPSELPASWRLLAHDPESEPEPEQRFSRSGLTSALKKRDTVCRITGCREAAQVAHICPRSEVGWFRRNAMFQYSVGSSDVDIDSPSNAYLLRADLHYLHDIPLFVFVPKRGLDGQLSPVFHLVEPSDELEALYHNRQVRPLKVSREFLFARFAWTIFPNLKHFLLAGVPRRLQLVRNSIGDPSALTSPDELETFAAKPATRSRSPKKRKPGPSGEEDAAGDDNPRRHKRHNSGGQCPKEGASDYTPSQGYPTDVTAEREHLQTRSHSPQCLVPSTPSSSSFSSLKEQWLSSERSRSDPEGHFESEKRWISEIYDGKILTGEDSKHWYEAQGFEFQDENP